MVELHISCIITRDRNSVSFRRLLYDLFKLIDFIDIYFVIAC